MQTFDPEKKGFKFKYLFILIILLLIIAVVTYLWIRLRNKSSEDVSENDQEKILMDEQLSRIDSASEMEKLARVGKEYIFEVDLEYYAYMNLESTDEIDRDEATTTLINESVLLQAGEEEGWIELSSEVFNNPFKNYIYRGELVSTVRDKFIEEKQDGMVVEIITVWFYNGYLGSYAQEYGLEAAEKVAKDAIDEIYREVTQNGKTLEEASKLVTENEFYEQLDMAYIGNGYDTRFFSNNMEENEAISGVTENLLDFLQTAKEGDLSEIILERDTPYDSDEIVDSYYALYYMKSKRESFDDIDQWVESVKKDFKIEIY